MSSSDAAAIAQDTSMVAVAALAAESGHPMPEAPETTTVTVVDGQELMLVDPGHGGQQTIMIKQQSQSNVKVEIDDAHTAAISGANSVLWDMDPEVLMPLVSRKLFERFSLWDLLLQKTKTMEDEGHPVENLFEETERVLLELKILVEACMKPIPKRHLGKGKEKPADGIQVSELLGTALCLDPGVWRRKDWRDIDYDCPLQLNELFPDETFKPKKKRKGKGGYQEGRVQPAPRFQNIRVKEEIFDEEDFPGSNVKFNDDFDDMNTIGPMFYDSDADPEFNPPSRPRKRGRGRPPKIAGGIKKEAKFKPKVVRKPKESKRVKFNPREEDKRFFCTHEGCEQAGISFASKGEAAEHFNLAHVKDLNRILPCYICDEKFAIALLRTQHMETTHEKGFGCAKCDKKFWRQRDAEEHVMKAHNPNETNENVDPSCVCYKCGRKFTSAAYVHAHESKCDGLFNRQPKFNKFNGEYICTEPGCTAGHGFASEYGLRIHFYDHHLRDDEKVFHCVHCGKKFGMRNMLNKHVAAAHEKKHICDYCGKGFGSKFKLKTHTFTHTGEKPYECDKCNYRTAKQYNLDQHKEKQHQDFGGRNHHCDLCGKQFISMGRVRMHMKQVHGTDGDGTELQEGQIVVTTATPSGKKKKKMQRQQTTTVQVAPQQATVVQAQPTVVAQVQQGGTTQYVVQGARVVHNMNMPMVDEQEAAVEYIQTELGRIEGIRYQ